MAVLVLGHQVVHAALGLGELHLVQALASVPVEENLPPDHGGELLRLNCSEMLLNSSWMEVLLPMKVADMCETGGPKLKKRAEEEERTVGV